MKKSAFFITIIILILIFASIFVYFKFFKERFTFGTIKYINLEGGFYGIVGDEGKNYLPLNLDESYKIDGTRVKFSFKEKEDIFTIYIWGTPIEILKIEKIK